MVAETYPSDQELLNTRNNEEVNWSINMDRKMTIADKVMLWSIALTIAISFWCTFINVNAWPLFVPVLLTYFAAKLD